MTSDPSMNVDSGHALDRLTHDACRPTALTSRSMDHDRHLSSHFDLGSHPDHVSRNTNFNIGSDSSSPSGTVNLQDGFANTSTVFRQSRIASDLDVSAMRDRHGVYHYPGPAIETLSPCDLRRGPSSQRGERDSSSTASSDIPVVEINSFSTW